MKKINRFILGGFISGLVLSLLTSIHLYTYSDRKISEIADNDCWDEIE